MKHYILRGLLVAAALAGGISLRAEAVLAGHPGFKGQKLEAETVKGVLLGKKVTIGDTRVIIVIAKASAAQDAFLQARVGMNTSQFQNHWRRLFMTGGGSAPKIVETEDDAAKVAAQTVGGIAAIEASKAEALTVLAAEK